MNVSLHYALIYDINIFWPSDKIFFSVEIEEFLKLFKRKKVFLDVPSTNKRSSE